MRSLTITLPDEIVQAIEAKVASGQYDTESDLVRDGLENFLSDDTDLENWLRDVVVPRCEHTESHPSAVAPIEGVLDRVQRRFADRR